MPKALVRTAAFGRPDPSVGGGRPVHRSTQGRGGTIRTQSGPHPAGRRCRPLLSTAPARAAMVAVAALAGCSGGDSVTGPSGAASVEVSPSSGSVDTGGTLQLTAVVKDASGSVLTGPTVTWSSGSASVATVSAAGLVTGVGAGTVTITAATEGRQGTASITVTPPPVTSVTVQGAERIKVGDTYAYSATLRIADGTEVQRPVTWSSPEPHRASVTPDGMLTPLQSGPIPLRATVDGVHWDVILDAYDWQYLTGSGSHFLTLPADVLVTNRFGTSEYPRLVLSCNTQTGYFFAWVQTEHFVTASGQVSYGFDGGTIVTQTWIEFSNFSTLGHPGPTNLQTKTFAATMASARVFGFAFTEFNGPARATLFRVTGLAGLLQPLFDGCPNNSLREATDAGAMREWRELNPPPAPSSQIASAREERRDADSRFVPAAPGLLSPAARVDSLGAVRRW